MRPHWLAPLLVPLVARADTGRCRIVDVQFTPTDKLQIVGWIEDAAGNYVDTIYVTQQAGTFGLGNRPGRFDFNSGPKWPYGRRTTLFPVWAHRHGKTFPEVVFQNLDDNNLSHPFSQSSSEPHFCRPMMDTEAGWDTGTCASAIFTDKGMFASPRADCTGYCSNSATTSCTTDGQCSGGGTCVQPVPGPHGDGEACIANVQCCSFVCDDGACTSSVRYPPRTDVARQAGTDSASVAMYAQLAPWDAVSQATPAAGTPVDVVWAIPKALALGSYVAWIEVGKEFDPNATYNATAYPPPSGIPWGAYGEAYRGQPPIVYRVPFAIGQTESIASTDSYAGYGDPDGIDGALRPPDATITTDTPASGAARLALVSDSGVMYRVRVDAHPEIASLPPDAPTALAAATIDSQDVVVAFTAPGATSTAVKGYDVRVRAGDPLTDANFDMSMPIAATFVPGAPAAQQTFEVDGLLPSTEYWIGIRAYDVCHDPSPLAVLAVHTADARVGEVAWCFVATAAYGSAMANDVELLRRFRDVVLERSVLGELAVESYYTFGPGVAGVVGESDLLRATARDVLAPIVRAVREAKP